MDRERHRLIDMVDALDQIDALLSGQSREILEEDRIARAAYERFLEIISEASRHLPETSRMLAPEIPWRRVGDLGNHLRHAYHKVDAEALWNLHALGELAALRQAVRRLLERLE